MEFKILLICVLAVGLICSIIVRRKHNINKQEILQKQRAEELKVHQTMVRAFGDVYVRDRGFCKCPRCKGYVKITTPSYVKEGKTYYSVKCGFCGRVTELTQNEVTCTSSF